MSRFSLVVLIIIFLAASGVVWWKSATRRPQAATYETMRVDRGHIEARATATGTLSALVTVQVGSQVSGRIQEIHVDFNSSVKKGEVLARIDPQLFQASLSQARASVLQSQANVTKAEAEKDNDERQVKRSQVLFEQHYITQADLDTASTTRDEAHAAVEVARAQVEQAKATLEQAEVNLAYTTISSPIDGTVISRTIDVGQTVAASLQAPTLFTIAEDMRKMQVDTNVAEADVGKIKGGMPASFTVDAYPNQRFLGVVRQVRVAPIVQQNVVTYDTVIDVDNPDLDLKPGMTANVTFTWAERDGVIRVPNSALRFRPPAEMLAMLGGSADSHVGHGRHGADKAGGGDADASGKRNDDKTGDGSGNPGRTDAGRTGAKGESKGKAARDPARRVVYSLRDGQPVAVQIRVGVSDGTLTELLTGELHEGEQLVTDVTGLPASSGAKSLLPNGNAPPGTRHMF